VLIELGNVFFMAGLEQQRCFRMGFSAIKPEKIDAGVQVLAEVMRETYASQAH
jgi:GntR family transcriptional regulator/MocR family aminotransferase